jgi:predicted MFS family arabinose efflux permease
MNLAVLSICLAFLRPRLPPRKSGPIVEWRAFTEAPYLCMLLGMSFVFGGLFFAYYYVASFGRTILHMSYSDSVDLLIIFNGVGIPVRLAIGYAADRYLGPLNTIVPMLFVHGMLSLCWIAVRSTSGMYAFTIFYGFGAAGFQCLLPTVATSLNDDLSKNGVRLGMAFSVFSFAGLAGPPIGGAVLTTNGGGRGGYLVAQICLGLLTMVGASLMFACRVNKAGWSLKVKT